MKNLFSLAALIFFISACSSTVQTAPTDDGAGSTDTSVATDEGTSTDESVVQDDGPNILDAAAMCEFLCSKEAACSPDMDDCMEGCGQMYPLILTNMVPGLVTNMIDCVTNTECSDIKSDDGTLLSHCAESQECWNSESAGAQEVDATIDALVERCLPPGEEAPSDLFSTEFAPMLGCLNDTVQGNFVTCMTEAECPDSEDAFFDLLGECLGGLGSVLFSDNSGDSPQQCGSTEECPPGYNCTRDGMCVSDDEDLGPICAGAMACFDECETAEEACIADCGTEETSESCAAACKDTAEVCKTPCTNDPAFPLLMDSYECLSGQCGQVPEGPEQEACYGDALKPDGACAEIAGSCLFGQRTCSSFVDCINICLFLGAPGACTETCLSELSLEAIALFTDIRTCSQTEACTMECVDAESELCDDCINDSTFSALFGEGETCSTEAEACLSH